MCETERTRFFRPWDSGSEDDNDLLEEEKEQYNKEQSDIASSSDDHPKMKIEEDEDEEVDTSSPVSYGCHCSSENDSVSRRSCSVNSGDTNSTESLNMLNKFVKNHEDDNRIQRNLSVEGSSNCYTSASAIEWSNPAATGFFRPSATGYPHPSACYQAHLQLPNAYLNGSAGVFQADYPWLSGSYHNVQEAVHRLSHQDAVAKQHRKLRLKKFGCHHCNMAFSNNGQLKGHLRIHTGERPFKCDNEKCGKAFTRNEELTRHTRIHTGLRPYSCPICRKCFGRKDHLKKHTKTHENRNAYQLAAVAAVATQFAGLHFATVHPHHPVPMPTAAAGLPYMYPL